jgi:hypothetical protein
MRLFSRRLLNDDFIIETMQSRTDDRRMINWKGVERKKSGNNLIFLTGMNRRTKTLKRAATPHKIRNAYLRIISLQFIRFILSRVGSECRRGLDW